MRKTENQSGLRENTKKMLRQGAAAAWPICLGYIPIGLAFGVLARQYGLEWWAVGLMSVLVFAGSAQFIAVSMLASGAAAPAIIATTFFVNLRHTLMSSALAVHLSRVSRPFLAVFAYGITDESFAVNIARFRMEGWDRWRALLVNQLSNFMWICATTLGAVAGQFVPEGAFGIDYALTAMFICLLVVQVYSLIYLVTALISGIIAIIWYIALPGYSYIVGASICAATMGYLIKRSRFNKSAGQGL
ncbi:MAG: AzlC family ABC transporter permease [Desulfobacterales bacterium]